MPTRFKYTPVISDTFGLSAEEILLADDKELNEYMSIKRLAPYRVKGSKGKGVKWEKLKELREKKQKRCIGEAGRV